VFAERFFEPRDLVDARWFGNVYAVYGRSERPRFIRGDADGSGVVDLSDGIAILSHLFLGEAQLRCEDAADADDSGAVELTDAIRLLVYLFVGSEPPPAAPHPEPGEDPTPDALPPCRSGGF
jgi:hypothetical protein